MEIKHKSYLKCDNNPCVCESIIKQVLQEATVEQQKVIQPDIIKEKVLDELPRRIDGDGMRWFSEEDVVKAYTLGQQEERQFILNVLDGIDIADEQMGNKGGGTKAIRFALSTRDIPNK